MTWSEQKALATSVRMLGGPSWKGNSADTGLPPKTKQVWRTHCAPAPVSGERVDCLVTWAGWGGQAGCAETDSRERGGQ